MANSNQQLSILAQRVAEFREWAREGSDSGRLAAQKARLLISRLQLSALEQRFVEGFNPTADDSASVDDQERQAVFESVG